MVKFYSPKQARPKLTQQVKSFHIDAMDVYGQGVCRTHQPVAFVEGALPGETCEAVVTSAHKNHVQASVKKIQQPVAARTQPFCPVYQQCGGCQLQHVETSAALDGRRQAIESYWRKHLKLSHIPWQAAIVGDKPAYRRKTRLAVDARDPDKFKLGFRQQSSNKVIAIDDCPILVASLSVLIKPLAELFSTQVSRTNIGHVTLLAGEQIQLVQVKLTRQASNELTKGLMAFAKNHQVNVAIEYADGKVIPLVTHQPLKCQLEDMSYITPEANDFVQINDSVNRKMINQAINWLCLSDTDTVADLFCGLGNFTLPLARRVTRVLAIEGVAEMVQRGQSNALEQGISNIQWQHGDLGQTSTVESILVEPLDAVVLDPSREGAMEVCKAISQSTIPKILYVSCNPTTFARDAVILLEQGYRMEKVSLIEMFPYTKHLELMALFSLPTSE
ncbi:23S rRNA (uracil(1939)-C(5))-methyltransferase RlmD [Alteromonas ponticola]|uniref:23S rRNA (Uracil(1939)-C(5))-methyltransferase RlmD n=1 Tax=Alteromonas aquimaris TaxID=2998417 RepID=A0ABT3P9I4_9ALTE|nr:23S rRNA (uracil(1939)-C(5))-methyltransferase RlmD [Alteromonas aquimaris]MCW8109434.1 23S rRNA (uracil(1939)-C(5))-methyltransferase RlmD [Alteromonas aquimaris]